MNLAAASTDASPLWMLVRATGMVDIILLTLSVALGVSVIGSGSIAGAPRFVVRHIHRDASLIAVVLLVAHVTAAVMLLHLDLVPTLVPFTSHVRRLYLGLGVLGADLMVAVAVTSMVRMRLGLRRWRWLHVSAYVAWAAAVVHGAAPGTDVLVPWVRYVDLLCVVAVVACGVVRLIQLQRHQPLRLLAGGAVAALILIGFISWLHAAPSSSPASSNRPDISASITTEN